MRRYLSNMGEVAHYWANEKQTYGESSNIFFEDNEIYSYGHHFMIGKIVHTEDGKRVYVLNSERYSSSTSKHQLAASCAIPHGETIFEVPDCSSPELHESGKGLYGYPMVIKGVMYYLECIASNILKDNRARKYSYAPEIRSDIAKMLKWINFWGADKRKKWYVYKFHDDKIVYQSVNTLMTQKNAVTRIRQMFCGDCFTLEKVLKAVNVYRFISERNMLEGMTDHEIADMSVEFVNQDKSKEIVEILKKERAKEEARRLKARKEQEQRDYEKSLVAIKKWKNHEINSLYIPDAFEKRKGWHTALRLNVVMTCVQSSQGIQIPIEEAKRLWEFVRKFHDGTPFTHQIAVDVRGSKWAFNKYEDDILTAGCHKIPYSEMEDIAKQLKLI